MKETLKAPTTQPVLEFKHFKLVVAQQFERMRKYELFRTATEKDALWETYLASFPAGTNPIFKERTEYDCTCCKQFIRAAGNMVAIIDGKIETLWDVEIGYPYNAVAQALSALVKSQPIANVFLHTETVAGTDKNFQQLEDRVTTWQHFFIELPRTVVVPKGTLGAQLGENRAAHDVCLRGLAEITPEAVDTVLELIAQNSL